MDKSICVKVKRPCKTGLRTAAIRTSLTCKPTWTAHCCRSSPPSIAAVRPVKPDIRRKCTIQR